MYQSTVKRAALGRAAQVGALYDVTTESFVHDSLFGSKLDEDSVDSLELGDTSVELITSDRIQDKFSKLDIEAELQVSLLAGLVKLSGSGAYFNEGKRSARAQCMSLLYKIRTVNEELMIRHHRDKIDTSLFMREGHPVATHVVVGIDYGAICSVTCECENSDGKDETTVKGALKAELEKLKALVSASGAARVEYKDQGQENEVKFSFKCKSDVSSTDKDLPVSFEGAVEMAKSLPKLVNETNNGKGVPLLYTMMPLDVVAKICRLEVSLERQLVTIREDTIKQSAHALEKLTEKSHKLYDIQRDLTAYGEYIEEERLAKIGEYVDDITLRIVGFKARLLELVTQVRRQEKDTSELDSFLADTVVDASPLAKYDGYIREFQRDINKVTMVKEWERRGIIYLGKSDLLLLDDKETVYVYYRPQNAVGVPNKNEEYFLRCQNTHSEQTNVAFKVVDQSIRPELWHAMDNTRTRIELYTKGRKTCSDCFEKNGHDMEMCLIRSKATPLRDNKPSERAAVELRCPNAVAGSGQCSGNPITWQCAKCKETVDYGLQNKKFYCRCGESEPTSAVFRCNEQEHGIDFIEYPTDLLQGELGELRAMREQNILILGETGVGKSTWINGIVNYMMFADLNEAKDADDFHVLIPSEFTFTKDNESVRIKVGKGSDNEVLQAGQSATQETRSYVFNLEKKKIRLIDTPGIGDVRGMDQDRKNFDNILSYLSHYEEIHAVCILLKPNNSRLTAMFRFCIQELLTHLHNSAKNNILFCFTNARATFYQPGDTLPALNKMLTDKEIGITANPNNYFCFDNEPLRFLACLHNGIKFRQDDIDTYATSWNKAVAVTESLFDVINTLKPHKVRNTLSMNEARRVIVAMSKPMAEVAKTIQENVQMADDAKQQIDLQERGMADLEKNLKFMGVDLIRSELPYPMTVCAHQKCIERISAGQKNVNQVVYKQVCHDHCYLDGIPIGTINDSRLQGCSCITGVDCDQCGHHYMEHMHLTYSMEQVEKEFISDEVKKLIMDKNTEKERKEEFKRQIDQKTRELQAEEEIILRTSARYGAYLKANAIIPYNDAVGDYIDMIVKHEEANPSVIRNDVRLQNLQRMRAEYDKQKQILDTAIERGQTTTPEVVMQLQQELFNLKHFGKTLSDIFEGSSNATAALLHFREVVAPTDKLPPSDQQSPVGQKSEGFLKRVSNWFSWR